MSPEFALRSLAVHIVGGVISALMLRLMKMKQAKETPRQSQHSDGA